MRATSRLGALALVLAIGATGCRVATEIDLTLTADGTLSADTLARARSLHVTASGDDNLTTEVALPRGLQKTETLVYRARSSHGQVTITLSVTDQGDQAIACSDPTSIVLAPEMAVAQTLILHACSAPPSDLGVGDLAVPDGGVDLAAPAGDLAPFDPDSGVGGPSKCAGDSGAVFCEGWEENPIPTTIWNLGSGSAPVRDTARAARGSASLHLFFPQSTTYQGSEIFRSIPAVDGPLYLRAFFYLPAPLPTKNISLVQMQHGSDYNDAITIEVRPPGVLSTGFTDSQTAHVTAGRWSCLELYFNSQTLDAAVWLDDQPVADLTKPLPSAGGVIDSIRLQFAEDTPPVAGNLWLDEVMVSRSRIGCAQ